MSPKQRLDELVATYTATHNPRLPNNVCRCHNAACPQAQQCRRFLQREIGGITVQHSANLSDGAQCSRFIAAQ